MGLSVNNDLVTLSDNFESLLKVEAIEIIVYGEKVLDDDSLGKILEKEIIF